MLEERSLKLDLVALVLLAFVLFLGLSVATYSPADPVGELITPLNQLYTPDVLVHPMNAEVTNLCGRWGAFTADLLFHLMGLGTYFLLVSLAVLDYLLLRRKEIESVVIRFSGWLISLVGFTTMTALLLPNSTVGPVIGSGGYLGALSSGLLQMEIAFLGSLIFATSLIIGGLLLTTDYVLFEAFASVSSLALTSTVNTIRFVRYGRDVFEYDTEAEETEEAGQEEASEEEEGEEEQVDEEPSIKIRGQRLENEDVEDEEAELEDEETEEDLDEEQFEDELEEEEDEEDEELIDEELEPAAETPKKSQAVSGPHFKIKKKEKKQQPNERQEVMEQLDAHEIDEAVDYELPDVNLLLESAEISFDAQAKEVRRKARILEKTFANFGFQVKVVEIETGPVIAQYEVELEAGLRLSRITGLSDDLAIALRVPSVRIVAPIPGKNTVGIEVPNETRQVVRLREVIEESSNKVSKMRIPIFLGKDVSGNALTVDLSSMPHLLIAGRTGTGKSVCLNAIISSILMTRTPEEVRMLMIDPKMVELSCYGRLPHLMHPVVTDMKKAEAILAWAVDKMEERYSLLARAGVRHISSYNQLSEEELMKRLQPETDEERESIPTSMPFIVIVADEMADLMMTAGKDVEQHIIRLAQKSRAVGIHLILATQKPTVDVITGLIKSNLPARLAFQVASRTDSRVVLDEMGADKLLGNGDMLFLWPGTSSLVRGQGTYLSDDEINMIVDSVSTHEQDFVNELVNLKIESDGTDTDAEKIRKRDDLYESAIDVVVRERRGSVSLLQRSLGIGYGRAARLIDYMAEDKIVGDYAGSQAREVMISVEDWELMQAGESLEATPAAPPPTPPKPPRSNKILPDPENDWEDGASDTDAPEKQAPAKPQLLKSKKKRQPVKATIPFAADESEHADDKDDVSGEELADEPQLEEETTLAALTNEDVDDREDVVAEEEEDAYDDEELEVDAEYEEDEEEVEDELDEEEYDEEEEEEDAEEEDVDSELDEDEDEEYEYEYVYEDADEEEVEAEAEAADEEWDDEYEESA